MFKRFYFVTMLLAIAILLVPAQALAASYPGSTITISAGDILYSSKGWQTAFAGHTSIVGTDGKIYHSTPAVASGGIGESVSSYFSRFTSGTKVEIYRFSPPRSGPYLQPINAAKWAKKNVGKIQKYDIVGGGNYRDITKNYCSKFLWQAYYFGGGVDLSFFPVDLDSDNTLAPNVITNSDLVDYIGVAKAP
ncbi:hypothetical protein EEL32_11485 [Brevibacillus laterosporus]|nr:hypothetical protein [Brevibacillus laterosporus]TPG70519.1 hypothetical protein EEL31_19920 [Brevibacillus laterosporus]TPG87741.1 hypothetical protein EEL32_11485 [Brevibacillus laterosporus]